MIRRLAASLALVGILTGCGTFSDPGTIARAGDQELSQELFDDLVEVLIGDAVDLPPPSTATAAEPLRGVITQWIQVSIIEQYLDDTGIEITDDVRANAEAAIDGDPGLADVSAGMRQFFIDTQAVIDTFNQLPDPQASFDQAFTDADVFVASRFGTFDADLLSVVTLGLAPGLSS